MLSTSISDSSNQLELSAEKSDTFKLSELLKEGQDYSKRKQQSVSLGSKLEETRYRDRATSVLHCAELLEFLRQEIAETEDVKYKLVNCWYCKHRLCSVCQHKRSIQLFARIMDVVARLTDSYRKTKPILLTLTVPNCDVTELRETIGKLHKAFKKLTQNKLFPGMAYIRSTEITVNRETGQAHPHLHVLLLVEEWYFKSKGYWSQERWTTEWEKAYKWQSDKRLVVDVRRVRAKNPDPNKPQFEEDLSAAIVEVVKYCVKSTDLVTPETKPEFLEEFVAQIKGLRFISIGGFFKQFLSKTEVQLDDKDEPVEVSKALLEKYIYRHELKDYFLIERRHVPSSS